MIHAAELDRPDVERLYTIVEFELGAQTSMTWSPSSCEIVAGVAGQRQ